MNPQQTTQVSAENNNRFSQEEISKLQHSFNQLSKRERQYFASLLQPLPAAPGWVKEWQPMSTAPKDRTIEFINEAGEQYLAVWSDRPVCMLGSRNGGFPPGWSTPIEADTDTNLPLDPGILWREYQPESIPQESPEEWPLDYCQARNRMFSILCRMENGATISGAEVSKVVALNKEVNVKYAEDGPKLTQTAAPTASVEESIKAVFDQLKTADIVEWDEVSEHSKEVFKLMFLAGAAEGKGAEAVVEPKSGIKDILIYPNGNIGAFGDDREQKEEIQQYGWMDELFKFLEKKGYDPTKIHFEAQLNGGQWKRVIPFKTEYGWNREFGDAKEI